MNPNVALNLVKVSKFTGLLDYMNCRNILNIEETNKLLSKKVLSQDPFFVSRIGLGELSIIYSYLKKKTIHQRISFARKLIRSPKYTLLMESHWREFSPIYFNAYKSADIQCVWTTLHMDKQMELLSMCGDFVIPIDALGIEPYRSLNPWTSALAGKRVLLISPFVGDFQAQHFKRKQIWVGRESILPDFKIIPYCSEFYFDQPTSWISVLEKMKNDISRIEFDIALISCGALGLPLGEFIRKDLKKSAIYMGAALQILFGVTGSRWESSDYFKQLINDSWIRPSGTKPASDDKLDNSCYW